jgi:lycopene cyclase domain-containing protein
MAEYLIILLGLLVVTIFLHKKFHLKIFETKKQMYVFFFIEYIIGIIWDSYAIFRGHWFYPKSGVLGIFIGNMPLEDYFFILIVPYFSLVIYKLIINRL